MEVLVKWQKCLKLFKRVSYSLKMRELNVPVEGKIIRNSYMADFYYCTNTHTTRDVASWFATFMAGNIKNEI